jgi:hypothetical protein
MGKGRAEMGYSTYDFTESLSGEVALSDVAAVLAAWGNVDKDGACCDECGGEWSGGFLCALKDGGYIYITGWCDYTGWGCQDGRSSTRYVERPHLSELEQFPESAWDLDPADLNEAVEKGEVGQ